MNLFPFCHMTQDRAAHCWHNNLIKTCLHLQQLKQTKLCLETPFVMISMWAFLVGKSHPMLLKGWLWDTGYHISVIRHYPPYLPLFVTIHNHFPLFKTICIIHTMCYSLFLTTVFAICHSGFLDPHIYVSCEYLARCHNWSWWFCLFS